MALVARRAPFLRRVPMRPVPRLPRYYEAATTSRRACPSAYGFASGFRTVSALRARHGAPDGRRVFRRAWSLVEPALRSRLPTYGRERDLSGSLVIPPSPMPCSKTPAEPVVLADSGLPGAAPGSNTPKASTGP
ncbi:MAG: hypothetical protein K0Q54_5046 [Methylobacterium brachiatum]|nr:hypothetical protein [Methylobacterium brachiatum]